MSGEDSLVRHAERIRIRAAKTIAFIEAPRKGNATATRKAIADAARMVFQKRDTTKRIREKLPIVLAQMLP